MQIFVLDPDPIIAGKSLCDKHTISQLKESCQLLASVHKNPPIKKTHMHHPCAKWVMEAKENYDWLLIHARSISEEYTSRYHRIHMYHPMLDWFHANEGTHKQKKQTPFVVAISEPTLSECLVVGNVVETYRNYYRFSKRRFAKWKQGNKPDWFEINSFPLEK